MKKKARNILIIEKEIDNNQRGSPINQFLLKITELWWKIRMRASSLLRYKDI